MFESRRNATSSAVEDVLLSRNAKNALLAAGAVVFVVAVWSMFATTKDTASATLVAMSLVLVFLGVFGDRVSSIEALGVKLAVAAAQAKKEGDDERAKRLDDLATDLLSRTTSAARRYEQIRASEPSSWERTGRLDTLIEGTAALASENARPDQVRGLFERGGDGDRITAIAVMAANPSLACQTCLAEAIAAPRSAFEQYHALKAARELAGVAPSDVSDDLRAAVAGSLAGLAPTSDRLRLAEELLSLVGAAEGRA